MDLTNLLNDKIETDVNFVSSPNRGLEPVVHPQRILRRCARPESLTYHTLTFRGNILQGLSWYLRICWTWQSMQNSVTRTASWAFETLGAATSVSDKSNPHRSPGWYSGHGIAWKWSSDSSTPMNSYRLCLVEIEVLTNQIKFCPSTSFGFDKQWQHIIVQNYMDHTVRDLLHPIPDLD